MPNKSSPIMLPIYKIGGKLYFRDVRLGEYRNIKNPYDSKRINDVPNSLLQIPSEKDRDIIRNLI